jgi:ABC-type transport system substrate-binding protein
MIKAYSLVLAALVLSALAAAGCSESRDGAIGDGSVRRGGTLFVALGNNPINFDPMIQNDVASGAVSAQVFEGLYLDAEAVRFSVDRVRDNPKSVGYSDGTSIASTSVLDKYTFRITLKEPFAPFPSRLTGRLGAVVSPSAVRSMGDEKFNLSPVGTGPFKFDQFRSDSHVRLSRFDDYWREGVDGKPLPYLDGVEFRIITEAANRLVALQAGDVYLAGLREADMTYRSPGRTPTSSSIRGRVSAGTASG